MSKVFALPDDEAADVLLRVYHDDGATPLALADMLDLLPQTAAVQDTLDAFVDAGLMLRASGVYRPTMTRADAPARREYARLSGARSCQNCHHMEKWDGLNGGCDWLIDDLCSACNPAQAPAPLLSPEILTRLLADVQAAQAQVEASRHLHRNQASGILGALAGSIRDVLSGALPVLTELNAQQDGAL